MLADLLPLPVALLERLAALGVDVARLLEAAGLPPSRFEGAKARITTAEFFAFWRALEGIGAPPDVGLRFGSDTRAYQFTVASMAALHSPTLGEAIRRLARYKRLVCPEEIVIEIVRREARLRFEWMLASEPPPDLLIDGIFASIVALARQATGKPIAAKRIDLTRRRSREAMLRRHFDCELRFDAPADLLVFDEAALAEPLLTHDRALLDVLVPDLEAALIDHRRARTLADDVRATLSRKIAGDRPSVEKVAKALGMSSRSLQRRLGEIGTTYQALLDDVRRLSARRLLARTDLDSGEVAFLLGFEELNSFTRAFQSWEGTTPTRWRTNARQSLAGG